MDKAFWDTRALVPICVHRQANTATLSLHRRYEKAVWWGTPVEMRCRLASMPSKADYPIGSVPRNRPATAHFNSSIPSPVTAEMA